jgi:hypothetical protein
MITISSIMDDKKDKLSNQLLLHSKVIDVGLNRKDYGSIPYNYDQKGTENHLIL